MIQGGAPKIAKLVNITPITMVYGRYNELVNGVYNPTYNWGAPSCRNLVFNQQTRGCEIMGPWENMGSSSIPSGYEHSHGKIHPFFIDKPSISMGHQYHGYIC